MCILQSAPVTSKCEWKSCEWLQSELCHRTLLYHTKWCRWLFAFLSFLVSQLMNQIFFLWSNLNTEVWNQGYRKTSTFRCSLFFWRKLQEELVKMLVVFRESGKNPTMSHQHALKLGNFNHRLLTPWIIGGLCTCNGFLQLDLRSCCCFRGQDLTLSASCPFTFTDHLLPSMNRGP